MITRDRRGSPSTALGLAALVIASALVGCEGDSGPPESIQPRPPLPPEAGILRVGGSGALLPLARALGGAYSSRDGAPRVVVEDSIGSGGGLRAVIDGAIDVALSARPLKASEREGGLEVSELGVDIVVMAAHVDLVGDGVRGNDLCAIFAGRRSTFLDGEPVSALLRDRGESANQAIDRQLPCFAEARELAYQRRGARIYYRDETVLAALAVTRGAVAPTSLAVLKAARLPLRVLPIDGVVPAPESVGDGRWKATRPILMARRADRGAAARAFMEFAAEPATRQLIERAGYLAKPTDGAR